MTTPGHPPNFDRHCQRRATAFKVWDDFVVGDQMAPVGGRLWAILTVGLPRAIDRLSRHLDRQAGRSFNGRWQRRFAQGHSAAPWLFMLAAVLFTMLGPLPRWRGLGAAATILAVLALYALVVRRVLARKPHGAGLFKLQLLTLLLLDGLLWLQADAAATEASGAPYLHVFAPILTLLMLLAALAFPFASWVLRGLTAENAPRFAGLLARTELFDPKITPKPSVRRFLHGLVNAPLYHPLHLLLLPALPIVLVPREYMPVHAALWLLLSWLILSFAGMYDRLNLAIRVVKRQFLIGGQGLVSVAIIVLAGLRLADVDYVSTLLDTASARVVAYYIVAAYSAFWLYEYWINRALGERLLPLLDANAGPQSRLAWVPYPIQADAKDSRVEAEGRAIELFAGGRFVATGAYEDDETKTTCGQWQPYERGELFQRLADTAAREGDGSSRRDINMAVAEVDKRSKLYFSALNIALLLLVGSLAWGLHTINRLGHQKPGLYGPLLPAAQSVSQPVDLRTQVFAPTGERRARIMLAVSGGGTRAALYAASVLRGLALQGRAGDVVLISGVSGGGAALAYFALHRQALVDATPGRCGPDELRALAAQPRPRDGEDPWCRFLEVMARPYIDDVLRGVSEWQVLQRKTTGHLLQESLTRAMAPDGGVPARPVIGELGLILNTTLAGHPASAHDGAQATVPCPNPQLTGRQPAALGASAAAAAVAPGPGDTWHGSSAGGILAFTNLVNLQAFPTDARALSCAPAERLPYVLVGVNRDGLMAAAALSANFPPVFPNAAVDVEQQSKGGTLTRRYWVTDGGAAENRGAVSLLYAVHGLLDGCIGSAQCSGPPPDLHLVVADASAQSFDYRPDRGLGAMTGASGKFSGQLMVDLARSAELKYSASMQGKLTVSYLPMPTLLRSRGGLGTHWMMPDNVTLRDDAALTDDSAERLDRLDRWDTLTLLACLHEPPPPGAPAASACMTAPFKPRLRERLRVSPHAQSWAALSHALSPRP